MSPLLLGTQRAENGGNVSKSTHLDTVFNLVLSTHKMGSLLALLEMWRLVSEARLLYCSSVTPSVRIPLSTITTCVATISIYLNILLLSLRLEAHQNVSFYVLTWNLKNGYFILF